MRTTLDIDEAVLAAARSLARAEGISLGTAVSTLALRGLRNPAATPMDVSYSPFPVLEGRTDHPVTMELVAAHRDD